MQPSFTQKVCTLEGRLRSLPPRISTQKLACLKGRGRKLIEEKYLLSEAAARQAQKIQELLDNHQEWIAQKEHRYQKFVNKRLTELETVQDYWTKQQDTCRTETLLKIKQLKEEADSQNQTIIDKAKIDYRNAQRSIHTQIATLKQSFTNFQTLLRTKHAEVNQKLQALVAFHCQSKTQLNAAHQQVCNTIKGYMENRQQLIEQQIQAYKKEIIEKDAKAATALQTIVEIL